MNIYVGNIAHAATEEDIKKHFEQFGHVNSVKKIKDKFTGADRGFAFVDMPEHEQAQKAITGTDGKDFMGRPLRVNEARPREATGAPRGGDSRPPRRNNFGGGNGGGFGGGRGNRF